MRLLPSLATACLLLVCFEKNAVARTLGVVIVNNTRPFLDGHFLSRAYARQTLQRYDDKILIDAAFLSHSLYSSNGWENIGAPLLFTGYGLPDELSDVPEEATGVRTLFLAWQEARADRDRVESGSSTSWEAREAAVSREQQAYQAANALWAAYKNQKKQNIREALQRLAENATTVDVWVFAHTNEEFQAFFGVESNSLIRKIRLLYNSGCRDASQGASMASLLPNGAYVGHVGNSSSPAYLPHFERAYFSGAAIETAVTQANQDLQRELRSPTFARCFSQMESSRFSLLSCLFGIAHAQVRSVQNRESSGVVGSIIRLFDSNQSVERPSLGMDLLQRLLPSQLSNLFDRSMERDFHDMTPNHLENSRIEGIVEGTEARGFGRLTNRFDHELTNTESSASSSSTPEVRH